jgi:uncharacterized membrane-anchored protein
MPGYAMSLPEALVLVLACAAYATFMWINFRAGKYVMVWSSAGIIMFQMASALGSDNLIAYMAAAGFHAALVATIFTASRKTSRTLAHETISTRD